MTDENESDRPEDAPPPGPPDKAAALPEPPLETRAPQASTTGAAPEIHVRELGEEAPALIEAGDDLVEPGQPVEPERTFTDEPLTVAEPEAGPAEVISPPEVHVAEALAEETIGAVDTPPGDAPALPEPGHEAPHIYFHAAGDPDEPPPEPDTSFEARVNAWWEKLRSTSKPHVEKAVTSAKAAAKAAGGEALHQLSRARPPRTIREAAVWSGWTAGALAALIVGFFFFVTWDLPSTDDVWEARHGQSVTFLDRNGHVILREGAQNAPPVDLASLPPYVPQAFVAIEDRRFYHHFGVDVGGMMRAGAQNLRAGRVVQGGSTITQQLAKNLFLTNERTWRRKAQELALAVWLETKFTKQEILALYLSRVYFGAGAYGVEAAAERYFDRPARELTLLQAAMLAGLVKAPSRLNPARQDIEAARARAETVLEEMVAQGSIGDAERRAAMQEELQISRRNPAGVLSYFRDWVDPLLNQVIGVQRDDFVIETTLDLAAQRAGAEAIDAVIAEQAEQINVHQGALVSLDSDGGVRALVGGRDYDQSQFNRATQAHRQPGSSFKYFIYLAAMEHGLTPWTVREDAPITIHIDGQPDWSPGNYHDEYNGPVELVRAFAMSYNMVAIRVANEIGGQNVINVARRLGVTSPLHNYHSLALGAQEVTLLEMSQAYGAMANEGYNISAHGVARIRRANGEVMWAWRAPARTLAIEARPRRLMNFMMSRVVQAGTGTRAQIEGRQIGAKTGTGNDYRDAWFIGFTPGLVTGVWVGNDNFSSMRRITGGTLPAEIWRRFMLVALRNVTGRALETPTTDDLLAGAVRPSQTEDASAVGAPIGVAAAPTAPDDQQDRSLDFGPEG